MLVCFLMNKLDRHLVFVSLNCYFKTRNFHNEPIWRLWCTFVRKLQKQDMEIISIERSTYEVIGLPFRSSKNC